jgi:hypothetical protein
MHSIERIDVLGAKLPAAADTALASTAHLTSALRRAERPTASTRSARMQRDENWPSQSAMPFEFKCRRKILRTSGGSALASAALHPVQPRTSHLNIPMSATRDSDGPVR